MRAAIAEARSKLATLLELVAPHLTPRSAHLARMLVHQISEKLRSVEEELPGSAFVKSVEGAPAWPPTPEQIEHGKILPLVPRVSPKANPPSPSGRAGREDGEA